MRLCVCVTPALPAGAAAPPGNAVPPADGIANTGVADTGVPHWQPLPQDAAKVAAKLQSFSEYKKARAAANANAGAVSPMRLCTREQPCGDSNQLPYVAMHPEGDGNRDPATGRPKTYTCGPAASRNVWLSMSGQDIPEHQWEIWEQTSPTTGTLIGNIANAMNAHTSAYWSVYTPRSAADLLWAVGADIDTNQAVIPNVQTMYLSFWGGHRALHYNMIYGYQHYTSSNPTILFGEEYDPVFTFGYLPPSYPVDPYGWHQEYLSNTWTAVHNSPSQSVVF